MKIEIQLSGQSVTLDVPEGMDPIAYANQVETNHYGQEEYDAASDSSVENFKAGMGRGLTNVARQVGNIVGAVSDEDLEDAAALDQDLLETGAGAAGNLVGEVAATIVPGGAAVKGAQAAAKGTRFAKALANPASVAAIDNAAAGAILAGPDNRGQGALTGAAVSGAMSGAGKVLKRTLAKPWVKKTDAAKAVEAEAGVDIPLSQSAEPGIWKQLYEGIVANIPGSGGKLRGQLDNAIEHWRKAVVDQATPPGFSWVSDVGDDIQAVMRNLNAAWDEAYDFSFKQAPIVLFKDTFKAPKVWDKVKPKDAPSLKVGQEVTGQDILTLKRDIGNVIADLKPKDWRRAEKLKEFQNSLDDVLARNLNPSGKGKGKWAQELDRYQELAPNYRAYQDIMAAAKKADGSEFTPKMLEKATNTRAGKEGIEGGARFSKSAKNARKALKNFTSQQGIFQTAAALGLAGGGGYLLDGPEGAALAVLGPIAGGKALASKTVQRGLTGGLPKQKAIADFLRRWQPQLENIGSLARRSAAAAAANEQ